MTFVQPAPAPPPRGGLTPAVRILTLLVLVMLSTGYAVAVYVSRDIWADRDGIRLTLGAQTKDGSAMSADTMARAITATGNRLEGHGVDDAEIVAEGDSVVATFPRHGLDAEALKVMFDPGETKTLYVRPVIHAMPAKGPARPPSTTAPSVPVPAQRITDERVLRQSTNPSIQILALQYQATRCGDDDPLAGHDDPKLPLITCSADGRTVYALAKSILGGDQIESAEAGTDSSGQNVIDVQFANDAASTWAGFTAANIGTQTAFTIDSRVVSAPEIREEIPNGGTQISGPFDATSARELAERITRGTSPVALSYVSTSDEKLPATMLSMATRVVMIFSGISLAGVVIGAVGYLLRAPRHGPPAPVTPHW